MSRVVRHICYPVGEHHEPCLIEYYRLYIGLVQICANEVNAIYFKPNAKRMCEAAGIKHKTAHCLRVTCASSLFNNGVDRKLIRDRTAHRSDVLMKYENANEKVQTNVSAKLGPSSNHQQ